MPYLLLTDETNQQPSEHARFFIYGGVFFPAAAVPDLRIRVFLDSELVVDQVNGRAKVGKEHIRPLHTEACSLLQEFPNIRISWVSRKWNAEADALATKALLGRLSAPGTDPRSKAGVTSIGSPAEGGTPGGRP